MIDIEEDMMPANICGNCLARSTRANPVRQDDRSGRRLCRSCEPNPVRYCDGCGSAKHRASGCPYLR